MAVELTVSLKGEDSTFKKKFLIYEDFMFKYNDPVIQECIKHAQKEARIEVEDIKIRANMQVQ